jgi:hypothetical protein
MAGRTGMGVGLGVTLFILSATTLGFGVGTAIFYTRSKDAEQALKNAQEATSEIISPAESNNDLIRTKIREAKAAKKSLVGFLKDEISGTMRLVTGNVADNAAALSIQMNRFEAIKDGAKPVMTHVTDLESLVKSMKGDVEKANADRSTALASLAAETERVKGIEDNFKRTFAALSAQVELNSKGVADYRSSVDTYKAQVDGVLSRSESDWATEKKGLSDQLTKLTEDNLALQAQVDRLRGVQGRQVVAPGNEIALVDATIIGVDSGARRVFLNIGEQQKVRIGMTFTAYSDAAAIMPDAEGNYSGGKATLEVINVGKNSSTAMITNEIRGNPLVQGDVVANAVFDPNKTYVFAISGNFDADRDGIATAQEIRQIEAMIKEWGAKFTTELGPEVDFVLMGERPVVPAQPAANAPPEVFRDFVRREDEVKKFDALYQASIRASVPVLNENRFYNLIGRTLGRPAAR